MTTQTKIEWTDFTVNFWEGCQKVGPGCDNCYAEARDIRFTGGSHWGPGAPRRVVKGGIAKLQKINRSAEQFRDQHGHWPRIFCSSLSDVFDNAVEKYWRDQAFMEMTLATRCRIILLTKRVGNVEDMVPPTWAKMQWPPHVGLMITVVNQAEADRDIPKLLDLKARLGIPWVGLSVEPMLGPMDLSEWLHPVTIKRSGAVGAPRLLRDNVDWVICSGESGPNARPMHPNWARSLRDQCEAAGTAFLFKQWGEWQPYSEYDEDLGPALYDDPPIRHPDASRRLRFDSICKDNDGTEYDLGKRGGFHRAPDGAFSGPKPMTMFRTGKKRAGRLLDGRTWDQFPGALT